MLEAKRTIGSVEIKYSVEGKDLKEDILKLSWLTNAPDKCGICSTPDITLQARNTKDKEGEEFIYAEFRCKKCWATATMGEFKNPKGALFIKPWKAYEKVEHVER